MQALNSRHLFSFYADLEKKDLGRTPLGERRIYTILGGRIEGRVNGTLLPTSGDWSLVDRDGCLRSDVRMTAQLDDESLVYMAFQGRMVFPPEVFSAAVSEADEAAVDPARYYMRIAPLFETASERYGWLNCILAVGAGRLTTTGVAYEVHEIL